MITAADPVLVDAAVERVERVVDGDTLTAIRLQVIGHTDDTELLARDRAPVRLRLIIVDTPERDDVVRWRMAGDQLRGWLADRAGRLRCRTYGRDTFGRLLADVYEPATGDTASAYLIARGWPPYAG